MQRPTVFENKKEGRKAGNPSLLNDNVVRRAKRPNSIFTEPHHSKSFNPISLSSARTLLVMTVEV